ncbi:putative lysozyme-like protein isoform X2 [Copidosoma floridanum]|uniref:putative lysozyme-like protein isoform X2 n=1 Tax=Copidosoma floridanum TaxID=29053 RepID=UPI0006C9A29D|nr:putative lysozyme-like protein isoform X2 [Copidosoma floridanum]
MSRRAVLLDTSAAFTACWLILATLGALARGFPAQEDDSDSAGPLPFIQFTKGGIRVNFGGYHAQAGLGGLLTGSKADGGLHASAGTPSGAHASAGLGGTLDGGPAGGLHARAGLGNGGPEAEAGLAGSLAGPRPQGEIVSRSSVGNLDNSILRNDKTKGKNIQVIARPKKATEEPSSSSSSGATASAGASVNNASAEEGPATASPTTKQPAGTTARKPWKYGIFARSPDTTSDADVKYKNKGTLFDDIFNIPISALNAVNQLLKNHVGKKK